MKCIALAGVFTLGTLAIHAQTPLQREILKLAIEAQGNVSVACSLPGTKLDCDLDARFEAPMQSAYKLPIGIAVLHSVEQGQLALNQQVSFMPSDIYPGTYSPLQDEYPKADVRISLQHLLELSVGRSDNTATDILLHLLGGPVAVQNYLDELGLGGLQVHDTERSLHDDEKRQYRNSGEAAAFVMLLRMLADHSPLSAEHTNDLLGIMTRSDSGPNRIRGLLPEGTVVAHKTGTSGYKNGIAAATNDVGLITLPGGQQLALAVLVTNAHADQSHVEHTIAAIAKACYGAGLTAIRKRGQ